MLLFSEVRVDYVLSSSCRISGVPPILYLYVLVLGCYIYLQDML